MFERKEKIIKSTERNDDSVTCPELPNALVFEFLIRLPIKMLFQCKCASKVWCSIIRDSGFVEAYRRQHPPVLAASITDRSSGFPQRRFYYSILGVEEPQNFVNSLNLSLRDCQDVTRSVNGVVCFHRKNHLFLGNIFTGEIKRVPDLVDIGLRGQEGQFKIPNDYHFGFDSVNGVYKLVKVSTAMKLHGSTRHNYEILTIRSRGSSWRKVAGGDINVPFLTSQSFLVNGVLYWIHVPMTASSECVVISLDLSTEIVRLFKAPDDNGQKFNAKWIVQFNGRPSFFLADDRKLILYTLDVDHEVYEWTKHEAPLPFEMQSSFTSKFAAPVGNLPSGEILLMNTKAQNGLTTLYAYNHEKSNFERFVVGEFPLSCLGRLRMNTNDFGFASCVEQNVGSLDALISGDGHSQ